MTDDRIEADDNGRPNWPSVAIAALTLAFFAFLAALCAGWRPWA